MSNFIDDLDLDKPLTPKDFEMSFPRFFSLKRVGKFILPDIDVDTEIQESSCLHEWVEYRGFREDYDFCKKCDQKKSKL